MPLLPQEWIPPQQPLELALGGWDQPDGHELATPGRIVLHDGLVGHSSTLQGRLQFLELVLILRRQDDGVGARWEVSRAALSGGMYHLSCEKPYREIPADDDVVGDGVLDLLGREGLTVKGSCFPG